MPISSQFMSFHFSTFTVRLRFLETNQVEIRQPLLCCRPRIFLDIGQDSRTRTSTSRGRLKKYTSSNTKHLIEQKNL